MRRGIALGVAVALAAGASHARACEGDVDEADSAPIMTVWPSLSLKADLQLPAPIVTDPSITSWKQNLTGAKGASPDPTINSIVSLIAADVQTVAYDGSSVYLKATGVPSHPVGPFPGNPAAPSDRNRTFRIPRAPAPQTGTHTATGLGAIGVMSNGVPLYNASDAHSYNNQNVWHQNANVVEESSFDAAPGHPAPVMGQTGNPIPGIYHYHQSPAALINQLDPGNTGQHHSPIIGYAFDGYPIYGDWGYANADGTGGITRIDSSYALRNITMRITLPDGTALPANQYGPAVSAQYPLGYYLEDFLYTAGAGDLDQYNGRFTITPDYPQGTYAYFATLDASGDAAYPYLVGPSYYGVVATDNLSQNGVTVPAGVTYYVPAPEPSSLAGLIGFSAVLLGKRRFRRRN